MKKIKEVLMKDVGWKILSVLIAICLWFFVINIENPIETRAYTVPIKLVNEELLYDKGLVLTNYSDIQNLSVSIKVRGQRLSLDRLSQKKSQIEATVDLGKIVTADISGGIVTLVVEIKLPNTGGDSFEITGRDVAFIEVEIDNIVSVEKRVEIIAEGELNNGYVMAQPVVTPEFVNVSGAKRDVNRVKSVKASISLDNAANDMIFNSVPVAYDFEGNIVENVSISENEVNINVGVNKSKKIPIKVEAIGSPEDGYIVGNTTLNYNYIDVVGSEEDIAYINELVLPSIDVEGKIENVKKSYYLTDIRKFLPPNVRFMEGSPSRIDIEVEIIKETERRMLIPASKITLEGALGENLSISISSDPIVVYIRGIEEKVLSVNESQISGNIKIDNLGVGEHIVNIYLSVPDGVYISGTIPTTTVTISETVKPFDTIDENSAAAEVPEEIVSE